MRVHKTSGGSKRGGGAGAALIHGSETGHDKQALLDLESFSLNRSRADSKSIQTPESPFYKDVKALNKKMCDVIFTKI